MRGPNTELRATKVQSRLAEIRQRRGVAAAALARQAGVSRQTIYAMEAGDYVPNTAVALRLAQALETAVEELFRLDPPQSGKPRTVTAELIGTGERFAGSPIELCRVAGRLVGVPAVPAPFQLQPADALLVNPARSAGASTGGSTVQLLRDLDTGSRLLIAGCDPATSVLARYLQRAGVTLVTAPVNSSVALQLLDRRTAHVAGTHLKDHLNDPGLKDSGGESGRSASKGLAIFAFAVWEQGLVVARGNPKKIRKVEDLARAGVNFVNREKGSGSRQLLDGLLKAARIPARLVKGYRDRPAGGHLAAAWRVYSGLGDSCIATRSSARAFGLDFLPLTSERYDLVIRQEYLELAAVERLLDTLTQAAFRQELAGRCAYDVRETGRRVA
jgi:putative molybdopterin biosynthesis protein